MAGNQLLAGRERPELRQKFKNLCRLFNAGIFNNLCYRKYSELKAAGQIQRQRFIQGISGAAYDPENVKKIGTDTWEVDLNVRLMEYKNNEPVKDVEILYPLKVTRRDVRKVIILMD